MGGHFGNFVTESFSSAGANCLTCSEFSRNSFDDVILCINGRKHDPFVEKIP